MGRSLSRANRNILWIEKYCFVPEGKSVGEPVRLRPWQKKELRKIYDNPHGTRRAIISMGRKNGKTALSAFLLLLHLCGLEAKPNSQLYSTALSREQASVIFKLAAKIVRMSAELRKYVRVRDTAREFLCEGRGTYYRALSADAPTAHGLSPAFIVHDELGQVRKPRSSLYDALETGTGAQQEPLSIIISTQAAKPNDLLSILIDEAKKSADKKTVLSIYTCPEDIAPFTIKAIRKANPAFGDFLQRDVALDMAEQAKNLPSQEAAYRNLILNQRVEVINSFISESAWNAAGAPVAESFAGYPVYAGLDLSATTDLTSLVLIADIDGVWHVKPYFWLPQEGLAEKGHADRQTYDIWAKRGLLLTTPGKAIEYRYLAGVIYDLTSDLDMRAVGFDRWGYQYLKPWLAEAGFRDAQIEGDDALFKNTGQGTRTMSPALREMEAAILNGRLVHGGHPVLTMCCENSIVVMDDAGNRKLSKKKSTGRIDGMVSLAMALFVAVNAPPEEPDYQMMVFG